MLEVLFVHAGQGQTFLRMALCGLIFGAALQARRALRRRLYAPHILWDLIPTAILAGCIFAVMLESGEGLRLYGLLGLVIGLTLYAAGIWQAIEWIKNRLKNIHSQKQEEPHAAMNNNRTKIPDAVRMDTGSDRT